MRVWDVAAGYLNRGSLLGEHRELHGLYNIVVHGKKGYSQHPETRRWVEALSGLACRHAQLAAEMTLRGYTDRSPLPHAGRGATWPSLFIDVPADQFAILRKKYDDKETGRIPLPRNPQQLWAQHKYSVMARDPAAYRRYGRSVAAMRGRAGMLTLTEELVTLLREAPTEGRLVNTLEHMWGYVRPMAEVDDRAAVEQGPAAMLAVTQRLVMTHREPYLMASTALSELAIHL